MTTHDMPLVDLVVGARPNLMKLAPVARALRSRNTLRFRIVHTGQHHDHALSDVFFDQLGIPDADVHLGAGSGTHGAQTARILERYEAHLMSSPAAGTVVFGDVNSTLACALAAVKLGIPVAHVEAGLRSFDRSMPEEINRILTDALASLLLVTEESGVTNLLKEGIPNSRIRVVGNVMIDTLLASLPLARAKAMPEALALSPRRYGFITIHRPSNVDDPTTLERLLRLFHELSSTLPMVFAVHPRTRKAAERAGLAALLEPQASRFITIGPQPYLETISLIDSASMVLSDSGGIQEEASILNVPCLTLRSNTERPVTVSHGTSRLVGNDPALIRSAFAQVASGKWSESMGIPFWDGAAGLRVADALADWLGGSGSTHEPQPVATAAT